MGDVVVASRERTEPYGSWPSPVTPEVVAAGGKSFHDVHVVGRTVSWIEQRPDEGGRGVIVACEPGGDAVEVTPAPWSARSRVYAYGGGAFTTDGSRFWFCNDDNQADATVGDPNDQRIHVVIPGRRPEPVTARGLFRYGGLAIDARHGGVLAVREDWREAVDELPRVEVVRISPSGRTTVLATGADFYAAPTVSPDGATLAWIEWDWPFMPWDATRLVTVSLDASGRPVGRPEVVAGGSSESITEPRWSPDGRLHFVSDRTGWASIYRLVDRRVEIVAAADRSEWTTPDWGLGVRTYAFEPDGRLWAARTKRGTWRLRAVGEKSDKVRSETAVSQVAAGDGIVAYVAAGPKMVPTVSIRTGPRDEPVRVRPSSSLGEDVLATVSVPVTISFPVGDDGATAHAFFYPPFNPGARAPRHERFPIVIRSHGGPSAATTSGLDLETQFFTSRGFGVVDVNYRGSTGFGRDYLLSLYGQWGVNDVADCAAAAAAVAADHGGDARRVVARGGSAGGYATNCLAAFTDTLAAGASYYGISDLIALVRHTENFERHYVDELVAPLPGNEDLYRERSPIFHADQVRCPMAFFQGAEDPVVPPDQTKKFAAALEQRGIDVVVELFPNEQHGFRIAEHLATALEAELSFYARHLGFPAEPSGRPAAPGPGAS